MLGLAILIPGIAAAAPQDQEYTNPQSAQSTRKAAPDQSNEQPAKITLQACDIPLETVIREIARQSKTQVFYETRSPILSKRITMSLRDVSLEAALAEATNGTDIVAKMSPDRNTIMVRTATTAASKRNSTAVGHVTGRVMDSVTKVRIVGATVTLQPGGRSVLTNDKGEYSFRDVAVGAYTIKVKIFGYKLLSFSGVLVDGATTNMSHLLVSVPTQLSGIVTTATGEQRKVEVGNDITTVRVDSIIRTMPVQNLSDLLATRVPGLYAAPTSGSPGAPTRIRIRGLSSVNQSNDPIIVVDGIRVASDQMSGSKNMAMTSSPAPVGAGYTANQYLVSSPLDMIDVNSIETVEVLKGPSAVALYGSDAANGVIVVTTKRGQAGPPRVGMSVQLGTETIPGEWPANYYMWGHLLTDPLGAANCSLMYQTQGLCAPDSLTTYQILNDPRRTVLGRGTTQTYRGEVSGSSGGMTYSLSGSINNVIGVVKLPDVDRALLVQAGERVSSWLRRPESDMKKGGALTVGMDIGRYSKVTFRSQLMHSATDASPLRNALGWARSAPPSIDTISSGLLAGIPGYRTRIQSQALKSTNSLNVLSTFGSRLVTQLTGGVDVTDKTDLATLGAGECFITTSNCKNDGVYNTGLGSATMSTVNVRATSPLQLRNLASLRSTIGVNYNRASSQNLIVQAEGLPTGATSGTGAARFEQTQAHSDRITAGMYLETVVGIANRWYFPLAIRRDAGSALGSQVMPKFPKLGVSYILSDDRWFQSLPGSGAISMLRMRAAYGQAGVQPGVSNKDRNYTETSVSFGGIATSYLSIRNIGNTQLRPERSKEYEGGFDLDVLNDRISTSVTLYRKNTVDLLTDVKTPPSVAGGSLQQVNVGDVINTGLEISLNVVPIEHRVIRLANSVQFSLNRNRLTKLGSYQLGSLGSNGFAIGYPLYGYWARPIVGVVDLNHDGMVSSTEYVLGDSTMYLGAPYPRYSINSNHTITILRRLSVTSVIQYDNGLTQNRSENTQTIRAYFDPKTPLELQAITQYSDLNKIQTVSVLRFDALSIGYDMPKSITNRFLRNRMMRVAVQARNVGLWTNYRGRDPKVNSAMGETNRDNGTVPQAKVWQLSVGIN